MMSLTSATLLLLHGTAIRVIEHRAEAEWSRSTCERREKKAAQRM